jgi:hypothetical protein
LDFIWFWAPLIFQITWLIEVLRFCDWKPRPIYDTWIWTLPYIFFSTAFYPYPEHSIDLALLMWTNELC